jgi:hypothetical protein
MFRLKIIFIFFCNSYCSRFIKEHNGDTTKALLSFKMQQDLNCSISYPASSILSQHTSPRHFLGPGQQAVVHARQADGAHLWD